MDFPTPLDVMTGSHKRNFRDRGYTVTSFHCSIIALRNHGSHHRSQFGSHEITAFLGKSGMGEVYPVHHTKLKRDVAIKSLPDESSRDRASHLFLAFAP